ncbi:MAG: potassium channel protein [Sulfobacillus thermosulfidooxidans]|uniref:Potassium channel protein n=1 Tax=Sulfobacillus thermotolerans TaxID=338644 RepID=A0ABM6RQT5_9FIRM|nr:NAD-binding protein [Sulfobacillus sp. hq2]AUW93739.1 hypothetical protein BXT84_07105 [Sulfobacillus thermotolerans]POB11582.1 hypothetical protein CO251_04310 [Sulfobacillus sp. hq2]PSR37160.1 MAG: potassium channel protein [Sulfobacillus thermosulfidooxidans]
MLGVIAGGILGFHMVYHAPWLLSMYFTIATMSTVSDSRLSPHGPIQIIFTTVMIAFGTGIWVFGLSLFVSYFLETDLGYFKERKMIREIGRLRQHFVIVGAGRVGESIARELTAMGEKVVMVDFEQSRVERVRKLGMQALVIANFDTEAMQQANLAHARGIALALPDDAQNLYAFLTARDANPDLQVVARAQTPESAHYLKSLGVERIILPDIVTGRRLARMLVKPVAQDLLMALLNEEGVHVQEIPVQADDAIANQPVQSVRDIYGEAVTLIGFWHDNHLHMAPRAQDIIVPGDTLILVQVDDDRAH